MIWVFLKWAETCIGKVPWSKFPLIRWTITFGKIPTGFREEF
jgi:hypothetical protein